MSQFRDAYDEFRRLNVEVASVSVDSPYAHRVWANELSIPFPMLSDLGRDLLGKYHALTADVPFLGKIAGYHAFVIDAARTLTNVWYRPDSGGLSPVAEVLESVRSPRPRPSRGEGPSGQT